MVERRHLAIPIVRGGTENTAELDIIHVLAMYLTALNGANTAIARYRSKERVDLARGIQRSNRARDTGTIDR